MAAPNVDLDIANLALDHLGQDSVSTLENPTETNAIIAARWYDQTRRGLLREYVWNFAKKRRVITRTGTPAFDFEDAYLLPTDFLRFLSIGGDIEQDQIFDYDIEGRNIILNNGGTSSLKLRYIADITDVTKFDPLFVEILALKLALNMSYKITLKKGVVQQVNQKLALELPKAVTIDGQERPPRRIERSVWRKKRLDGRYTGIAGKYTVFDN